MSGKKYTKMSNFLGITISAYIIISLLVIAALSIVVASKCNSENNSENYAENNATNNSNNMDDVGVPPWGKDFCNCFGPQHDGSAEMPDGPITGAYCTDYQNIASFYKNSPDISKNWSCIV